MTGINIFKLLLYMGVIVALTPIFFLYIKRVFA